MIIVERKKKIFVEKFFFGKMFRNHYFFFFSSPTLKEWNQSRIFLSSFYGEDEEKQALRLINDYTETQMNIVLPLASLLWYTYWFTVFLYLMLTLLFWMFIWNSSLRYFDKNTFLELSGKKVQLYIIKPPTFITSFIVVLKYCKLNMCDIGLNAQFLNRCVVEFF